MYIERRLPCSKPMGRLWESWMDKVITIVRVRVNHVTYRDYKHKHRSDDTGKYILYQRVRSLASGDSGYGQGTLASSSTQFDCIH